MAEQSDADWKKHDQVMAERKVLTPMSHHPSAGMPCFFKAPAMEVWSPFSSMNFSDTPSHRIFGHMHETLNIDKK
jgi:hypothetical protein